MWMGIGCRPCSPPATALDKESTGAWRQDGEWPQADVEMKKTPDT